MALRLPDMCFWPAKTGKKLELFGKHTCHWLGAQTWFRHNWKGLDTASLLLLSSILFSCLRYWIQFFSAVFRVSDRIFLVLHIDGKVFNWIPEVMWPRMYCFWVSCWNMTSFVVFTSAWTKSSTICSIVILFWRYRPYLIVSSSFILVCSKWMLVLFSFNILQYRLRCFRKAMQLYFPSFCVYQPFFPGSSGNFLWLLLKPE